jgi:3-deoxy-D-manno-octulosonic-acid transferase
MINIFVILLITIFFELIFSLILSLFDSYYYNIKLHKLINRINILNFNKIDVLIHASSCGESKLSLPIIKKLEEKNIKVKLSVHTPTGFELVKKYTNKAFLKPYDTFFTTFYMFYKLRPKVIIISVSDTWPYFILFSKLFGCKIFYVNYKIKKNKVLRNYIHYIISEKIYLSQQNIETKKYSYLGDLKLLEKNQNIHSKKNKLRIIIASANKNEFDLHLEYIKYLIKKYPKIQIIYVPRHLNWLEFFKNKIKDIDYYFINNIDDIDKYDNKLFICWKIGLLNQLYSKTNICLIGDTFNRIGGHNLIEPGLNKNTILTGPNVHTIKNQINILDNVIMNNNLNELIINTEYLIVNKKYKKYGEDNYKCIINKKNQIENNLNKFIIELLIICIN